MPTREQRLPMNAYSQYPYLIQTVQDPAYCCDFRLCEKATETRALSPFNISVGSTSWVLHWHLIPRHKTRFSLKLQDFHFAQFQMV